MAFAVVGSDDTKPGRRVLSRLKKASSEADRSTPQSRRLADYVSHPKESLELLGEEIRMEPEPGPSDAFEDLARQVLCHYQQQVLKNAHLIGAVPAYAPLNRTVGQDETVDVESIRDDLDILKADTSRQGSAQRRKDEAAERISRRLALEGVFPVAVDRLAKSFGRMLDPVSIKTGTELHDLLGQMGDMAILVALALPDPPPGIWGPEAPLNSEELQCTRELLQTFAVTATREQKGVKPRAELETSLPGLRADLFEKKFALVEKPEDFKELDLDDVFDTLIKTCKNPEKPVKIEKKAIKAKEKLFPWIQKRKNQPDPPPAFLKSHLWSKRRPNPEYTAYQEKMEYFEKLEAASKHIDTIFAAAKAAQAAAARTAFNVWPSFDRLYNRRKHETYDALQVKDKIQQIKAGLTEDVLTRHAHDAAERVNTENAARCREDLSQLAELVAQQPEVWADSEKREMLKHVMRVSVASLHPDVRFGVLADVLEDCERHQFVFPASFANAFLEVAGLPTEPGTVFRAEA
jgi:hypothetical protein